MHYLTPAPQQSYEIGVIRAILQTRKLGRAKDDKVELGISPKCTQLYEDGAFEPSVEGQVIGGRRKRKNPWAT